MSKTPPRPLAAGVPAELRAEVARQGLTQEQLAERLGERQWWISRRLRGHVPVSADELVRFAAALGVEPASLLPTPALRPRRKVSAA